MDHKTTVDGFSSLEELAETVGNLRYDALIGFISALEIKLMKDSDADMARGRPKLSMALHAARWYLGEVRLAIYRAWEICQPHMET